MPRAPSARIQARRERAAQANEEAARGQMARPNHAGQGNRRNPLPTPARANHRRQEEEEVQQELVHEEGANYADEDMDEDYVVEEEEEGSEEVELEPEEEEQELPEPPLNDLVAVMAQQTRLLSLSRTDKDAARTPTDQKPDSQSL